MAALRMFLPFARLTGFCAAEEYWMGSAEYGGQHLLVAGTSMT
jgi:hypothetical protein